MVSLTTPGSPELAEVLVRVIVYASGVPIDTGLVDGLTDLARLNVAGGSPGMGRLAHISPTSPPFLFSSPSCRIAWKRYVCPGISPAGVIVAAFQRTSVEES